MIKQIPAFVLIVILLLSFFTGVAESRQAWRRFSFDGKEFREGADLSEASVYVREGYLPVMQMGNEAIPADPLPAGTGGLVVFCYKEVAGGKLQSHGGYAPLAGTSVDITKDGRTMAIRSDMNGYSILALPAGGYEVRVQGVMRRLRVEKGQTALVTIRAGKRMTD
jgi:hypothetical protein